MNCWIYDLIIWRLTLSTSTSDLIDLRDHRLSLCLLGALSVSSFRRPFLHLELHIINHTICSSRILSWLSPLCVDLFNLIKEFLGIGILIVEILKLPRHLAIWLGSNLSCSSVEIPYHGLIHHDLLWHANFNLRRSVIYWREIALVG